MVGRTKRRKEGWRLMLATDCSKAAIVAFSPWDFMQYLLWVSESNRVMSGLEIF